MKSNFKTLFCLLITFLSFSLFTSSVEASIISIAENGQVMVKVLSAETSQALLDEWGGSASVEVTKVQNVNLNDPSVAITKSSGKVAMTVLSEGTYNELDVTDIKDDLIEIEQRPKVQKLTISADEKGFNLKQGSFIAQTPYPIEVDAKTARFTLTTPKGKEFVSILPVEAVESALRSGLMSKITDSNITIDSSVDNLSYNITGEKVFNILNVTEYGLPVSVMVSANDGHIVSIDSESPIYKILKIFFI